MTQTELLWQNYRKRVFTNPEELPAIQETECSLAFFAGMHAAIWRLSDIANTAKTEDEGARGIEAWRKEVIAEVARVNLTRQSGE